MTGKKSLIDALNCTNKLLNDIMFMYENRVKSKFFTRSYKMGFKDIMLFTINFVKKTLQIELDLFFKNIKGEPSITKQSFSEARQKILPSAFSRMFYNIVEWYYGDDCFKKFMGYRLLAIDGSVIGINNSQQLREAYGCEGNEKTQVARALVTGIYDIENDMMVAAKIVNCKADERNVAIELLSELKKLGFKNDLILFDRGFPSTKLISLLQNNGISYVMRVSSMFLKVINEAKKSDQLVEILDADKKPIKIRVVRFKLGSEEEELLITNLFDNSLTIDDFKKIYFKRWGIEIKYDELKNKLQIENFTGNTPLTIEQDFYASMYLVNMAAIAKAEANEKIQEKNKGKNLKYDYKVNNNILIGKLKDRLILMLLENNSKKRSAMLNKIMAELSRNVVPIRPGRSYVRRTGVKSNKYSLNQKKSL